MHYLIALGLWILAFVWAGQGMAKELLKDSSDEVINRGGIIGGWIGFTLFVLLLAQLGLFN